MKRDVDLIRIIMTKLEETPYEGGWVDLAIEGHDEAKVSYHIMLLDEAGLIEATDVSTLKRVEWKANRLTWAGHEFIEASRDVTRWEEAKKTVLEKSGGIAFSVLNELLIRLMSRSVLGG